MSLKKIIPLAAILILGAALLWTIFYWQPQSIAPERTVSSPQETERGGDFVLQSAAGPLALKDLRGKVVLLYFGYTWCPDICPTSLALMGQAMARLEPAELEQVQGIFVSVDPERDTLERLATYTNYFHPRIAGVTGTPEEVAKAARLYGAAYRKVDSDSATDYVVDHSSVTYVIGRDGKLETILEHGAMPDRIIGAVRNQLNK